MLIVHTMFLKIFIFSWLFVEIKGQSLKLEENGNKLYTLSDIGRRNFLTPSLNEDVNLTVPELVTKNGYPIEEHEIQTHDKYLLTVHRIPYGKKNKQIKNRKPILLMHGILESSADWILLGPERSLGYILADMGYDVWIGNARGNKHSRRHLYLDPDRDADKFWDFSWHQIGVYDLPAMIDYILKETNNKQIRYIGHSQGCTTFFVMTSLRPEYNDKVAVMFALAPAVFMGNVKSPLLKYAAKFLSASKLILYIFGRNEFLPSTNFMKDLGSILCDEQSITQGLCKNTLFMLAGFDEAQLDRERLPVLLSNSPAGCSSKQLLHFLQNTRNPKNKFSLFDHGLKKNLAIYSKLFPPEYPLDRVTVPVALFSGFNDLFVDIKDVDKLASKLQNVFLNYRVPLKEFTHLDFLWAKDVVPLLYHVVIEELSKIDSKYE